MTWNRSAWVSYASVLLVALCLFLVRSAHGAEIRVDADTVVERASSKVFGNSIILGGDTMGFNRWASTQAQYEEAEREWNATLPYLRELGPTVLRYPGGLTANNFNWKEGIGPFEERNPDYGGKGIRQTFGTDEFLRYCEELGSDALLVVNVSVAGKRPGTVQDAADWVEYCNAPDDGWNRGGGVNWAAARAANGHKEPYGVRYWELGNEDIYPGMENYADRVIAYSKAMKAIDPTIQVGVIGTAGGMDPVYAQANWLQYRSSLLERAGDSFDFWAQHLHLPSSTGVVNGFAMVKEGASVEVNFSVDQAGAYWFEVPAEGRCRIGQCPVLSLQVDGNKIAAWKVPLLGLLRSETIDLRPGEHSLRLVAEQLADGARITVRQQLNLFRTGQADPQWIDLKKSRTWYHALFGGWPVGEKVYQTGEPYTGGKPVFYTEANTVYQENTSLPYFSKACYLREMLHTGCIYHFFLRNGVPLATYWLLFQESAGVGVLEGVAYDKETDEWGRPDPHRRPVFHLLKAYRWNVFDQIVSTEVSESPSFPVGVQTGITVGYASQNFEISSLQALATKTDAGDRLSLFVINLDPDRDLETNVSLQGFGRKDSVKVLTISGPSENASNEPEDCPAGNCVTTREQRLQIWGNPFSYRFPRHSVTVFVFARTGSDEQPPGAPAALKRSTGNEKVLLMWEPNRASDLAGYNVYRSRLPDGPYRNRINEALIEAPEYLDPGLDNDVPYTYAVTAVDRSGNESGFSNIVTATPLADLEDPDTDPSEGSTCTAEGPLGDATCNDGMDNDCDGFTDGADCDCAYTGCANAEASTFGPGGAPVGSGMLNELIFLLIPVGAVLLLKRLRKRL